MVIQEVTGEPCKSARKMGCGTRTTPLIFKPDKPAQQADAAAPPAPSKATSEAEPAKVAQQAKAQAPSLTDAAQRKHRFENEPELLRAPPVTRGS